MTKQSKNQPAVAVNNTALAPYQDVRNRLVAAVDSLFESGASGEVNDFVRFAKDGEWLFGDPARGEKPLNGRRALVNINNVRNGWICWGKDEGGKPKKLDEAMVLSGDPIPKRADLPNHDGDDGNWMEQRVLQMKFVDGPQEQFRWGVTSKGGMNAVSVLLKSVVERMDTTSDGSFMPLVKLGSRHYKHSQFGKVFVPVCEIVEWRAESNAALESQPGPTEAITASDDINGDYPGDGDWLS